VLDGKRWPGRYAAAHNGRVKRAVLRTTLVLP
jgi:hypothetical protein